MPQMKPPPSSPPPETYYGAVEGGHCYQVVSETELEEPAVLKMAKDESGLDGWFFMKSGEKNSKDKYVYLLLREDTENPDGFPTWKSIVRTVKDEK